MEEDKQNHEFNTFKIKPEELQKILDLKDLDRPHVQVVESYSYITT